jgi:hypothetical protein
MDDFLTGLASPQAGDRKPKKPGFVESDLPGFLNPEGNPGLYIKADDPEGKAYSREEAQAEAAKKPKERGDLLYPQTPS